MLLNCLVNVLLAVLIVGAVLIIFLGLVAFTLIIIDAIRQPPRKVARRRRAFSPSENSPESIRGPWKR